MRSKHETVWGDITVSVSADWAQASCSVEGDTHGRQVADFRHCWKRALRAQLEDMTSIEGMDDDEAKAAIDKAMGNAVSVDDIDVETIDDPWSDEAKWRADETTEETIIRSLKDAVIDKDDGLIRGWTCVTIAKEMIFTVETGNEDCDIHDDETNYVTVSRKLVNGKDTIAEWTICAQGWWVNQKGGHPNHHVGWNVEENTDGGDGLPSHIEIMTELFDLTGKAKELPDAPKPDDPEDCDLEDAKFCVMVRNTYTQGMEEFEPRSYHLDEVSAQRAMMGSQRSFVSANSANSYGPEWCVGQKNDEGEWKPSINEDEDY